MSAQPRTSKNIRRKQTSRWSRKRKVLVGILISILLVITLAIMIPILSLTIRLANLPRQVAHARQESEKVFDQIRTEEISALVDAGIIPSGSPTHSSKVDACYVASSDLGWTVKGYYQQCYIRYIDAFSTDKNSQTALLSLSNRESRETPLPQYIRQAEYSCGGYIPSSLPLNGSAFYYAHAKPEGSKDDCKLPDQNYGEKVVLYARYGDRFSSHTKRSFDESTVSWDHDYIILVTDNTYFQSSLGCKQPVILFCDNPVDGPKTGY